MGVATQELRLLLVARSMGVKFDRTITMGRQDLLMTPHQLRKVCQSFGLSIDEGEAQRIAFDADRFSEPLFEKLGATKVDSMDASGFEGATVIHDLNEPLPSGLAGQYSLVFDGGTLEHVFSFPSAIRCCMELAALGGHVIVASPANNDMGHGFYQFGPDIFYRVFSPENGYQLQALFLVPAYTTDGDWFKVMDPAKVGRRIGYNESLKPLYLYAIAQRVSLVPIFLRAPQQQDYSKEWKTRPNKGVDPSRLTWFDNEIAAAEQDRMRWGKVKRILRGLAPKVVLRWVQTWRVAWKAVRPPNSRDFKPFPIPPL